ncbi:hypothetical protein [Kitasatospora sp. NPDC004272]
MNTHQLLAYPLAAVSGLALYLLYDRLMHLARTRRTAPAHHRPPTAEQLALRMHNAETMPDAVARHNPAVVQAERIINAAVRRLPADERRRLDHHG